MPCKRTSVIPYELLCMWFPNATNQTTLFSNWCDCELDGWIYIFTTRVLTFWIQPSDLNVQEGFFKRKRSRRWEGCPKQMDTALSHCCISFKLRFHTWYANPEKNGKHVNVRAWFYRSVCDWICNKTDSWIQNFTKLFQGLISRLTTSWVTDHVKWHCRLHWIIKN